MTQIAIAASVQGRTRLLLVLLMLAALMILMVAVAFAFPALQHTGLGHILAGALAAEGGPPPGH